MSAPPPADRGESGRAVTVEIGANEAEKSRNRATGAGAIDDPYPRYDELRETGPVHEGAIAAAFGLPGGAVIGWADRRIFSCYDWDTVDTVLSDPETFSSRWYQPTLEPTVGVSLLQLDGDAHRRHRELAQPALLRGQVERWRERWIEPTANRILEDCVATGGRVDLYSKLCAHLPVHTIASSFGIAAADVPHFHELAIRAVGGVMTNPLDAFQASQEIAVYLRRVVAERRIEPQDDLISILCAAEMRDPDGGRHVLEADEILAFARVMLPAGAGTTYRGLGCMLLGLLQTGQLDRLRRERWRLEEAIEEALRWEQPLTSLGRIATRDTELGGVAIPEGSVVYACLAAANHDPARWSDPHRFDITRERRVHASFGLGPHFCIGAHLARLEMRTVMNTLLDRFPKLQLDPDAPAPWITGLLFRMPTAVPVVLES
ncbi:MAG: cytochrome P450 [Deltaproteobacteria bacterium]|nr:cytochrome P450 [Deltaproteobacteria bacterium]